MAEPEIVTRLAVSRGQAVDGLQSLSRGTKSPYLSLENPQTVVGALQRRAVWCAVWMLSVDVGGITCLFTISIQISQLT